MGGPVSGEQVIAGVGMVNTKFAVDAPLEVRIISAVKPRSQESECWN